MTVLPSPARDHDLVAIQCLRGIAAAMVVVFHCFPQLAHMGYAGDEQLWLSAGVDIFFIISGFIMLISSHRSPGRGAASFLVNRAVRILPIYWLLTSVMVALALAVPNLLNATRFEPWHVLASYLMIPARHPTLPFYWPILIPGWTLNYEVFFYVLFAGALAVTADRGWRLAAIVGGLVVACAAAGAVVPADGVAGFYTDSVIVEFAFGLVLALAYLRAWRLPRVVAVAAGAGGIAALVASGLVAHPDVRGLVYGVPALAIVTGAVLSGWRQGGTVTRLLRVVGDASYSIYLTHMLTMGVVGQVWRRWVGAGSPWLVAAFIVVATLICIVAGAIFYRVVERPLTRRLQALTRIGRVTVRR